MSMEPKRTKQHFLVVTYHALGHINPGRQLARRLALATGANVTLSTPIAGHRRLFPSGEDHVGEVDDGLISYIPYSDGYDHGFTFASDPVDFKSRTRAYGYKSLSAVVQSLADRGRPVTCIIYALLLPWVPDLARDLGIRSALYWIQPAAVFAAYYHYFHGYDQAIKAAMGDPLAHVQLPGLPLLRVRDLPSLLTITSTDPYIYSVLLDMFKELFDKLDMDDETKILANTFDELETDAFSCVHKFKFYAIGPMVPFLSPDAAATVVNGAETKACMDWLDSKPENSVVYASFGSISRLKKKQLEEMQWGLKESGRPYLWVVRKDNRDDGGLNIIEDASETGMVVEWCDQMRVLSHPSVGCFVTHCGWNSTLESLYCGVPTVCFPQWTDQGTNTRLMEEWGTGVRAELNAEGVLEGKELLRCLQAVMAADGEEGHGDVRRKATAWMSKARTAIGEGGSSDRNLRAFIEDVSGDLTVAKEERDVCGVAIN